MKEIKIPQSWFIQLQKLVNKFEDSKDSNDLDYLLGYLQSVDEIIKIR